MAEQTFRGPGYERRDANVRIVGWFAIGLVASCVGILSGVDALYKLFRARQSSSAPPSRIAFDPQMRAPEPRLQINPQADLASFAAEEERQLNSYGWIDCNAGVVHIPIARAMDLIAERGLPTRGQGTNNSSGITPEQLQQQKAIATKP